jgi:hypothetical protein
MSRDRRPIDMRYPSAAEQANSKHVSSALLTATLQAHRAGASFHTGRVRRTGHPSKMDFLPGAQWRALL